MSMGFFAAYRQHQNQLAYYQMPDAGNPLSWGAVRENIEQASNRDFLKHAGASTFSKIQGMFLKKPSISAGRDYRPGSTRSSQIERPGFLQGLD